MAASRSSRNARISLSDYVASRPSTQLCSHTKPPKISQSVTCLFLAKKAIRWNIPETPNN